MAQYRLTTEQQTNFDYNFHMYFEMKSMAAQMMPWVTAPVAYNLKYYVPKRLPEPIITKDFSKEELAEPQYSELANPTSAISLDLEIQDTDLRIAAQSPGMAIDAAWARLAAAQMDLKILKTIISGNTTTEMEGLLDKSAYSSTYDTVKWNAATGPHLTFADLINNSACLWPAFQPPYVAILSANLLTGWNTTINAAPVSAIMNGDLALRLLNGNQSGDTSNLFWARITPATVVANQIYPFPLPAGSDDGRIIIMKPVQDGNVAVTGVWCEPLHSTEWQFDGKTDRWHTKIKAMIGLKVFDTAAIADHTSVNFA
jgi:hypothetical protein